MLSLTERGDGLQSAVLEPFPPPFLPPLPPSQVAVRKKRGEEKKINFERVGV